MIKSNNFEQIYNKKVDFCLVKGFKRLIMKFMKKIIQVHHCLFKSTKIKFIFMKNEWFN